MSLGPDELVRVTLANGFTHWTRAADLLHERGTKSQARGGEAARDALGARYGRRVYAWEHRYLAQSPIVNALDLVRLLPQGAELDALRFIASTDRAPTPPSGSFLDWKGLGPNSGWVHLALRPPGQGDNRRQLLSCILDTRTQRWV